jgi:hypothetical protein
MKKNKKDKSPESSEVKNRKTVRPAADIEQGGENPSFPQEYEEQLSNDIRMKPQPLEVQEKTTSE